MYPRGPSQQSVFSVCPGDLEPVADVPGVPRRVRAERRLRIAVVDPVEAGETGVERITERRRARADRGIGADDRHRHRSTGRIALVKTLEAATDAAYAV